MSPPRYSYLMIGQQLQAMRDADQLNTLARAWELYLIFHHRTWNKCEAHYKGKRFWGSLLPKYAARRKQDTLLVYIHQARHVDEHGIQPITKQQRGSTVVSAGTLTSGTRIIGGESHVLGPESTATIKVSPSTILSERVTNKRIDYDPPILDGSPNPPVIRLAEEAIMFFDDLFAEIDMAGGD